MNNLRFSKNPYIERVLTVLAKLKFVSLNKKSSTLTIFLQEVNHVSIDSLKFCFV
ncbi:hypothetical protein EMIT074MI3_30232 [Bacillus licheniformis]